MKLFYYLLTLFLLVNTESKSQVSLESFKKDFSKIIVEKKFEIFKNHHLKILFLSVDGESLEIKHVYQPIDLSKKEGIADLNKVKITKNGTYENLYDHYLLRVTNNYKPGGIQEGGLYEEKDRKLLKEFKGFLQGIKNVSIYRMIYPYMSFDLCIDNQNWYIICVNDDMVMPDDDLATQKKIKSVIHIFKHDNMSL